MIIKIITIIFSELNLANRDLPKLRGYFAQKFPQKVEFHHHLPDGKFAYTFPKIQYRIIQKHPAIIGIQDAVDDIKKVFFDTNELNISHRKYTINEKEISLHEEKFGISPKYIDYKFSSPWMALNEKNFEKFHHLDKVEQQELLKKIIIGNIITVAKGLGYTIPQDFQIKVIGYFKPQKVNFKNQKMLCFSGEFSTNFQIPNLFGLGKQSARGFGVVERNS